jgi:hypothetical protein
MITRIEGYLLIPHELLHIVGYRLVGKQCRYRWGDCFVTPIGSMTQKEELVGLLFPFVVCLTLWLILLPLPLAALFVGGVGWAITLSVIFSIPLTYAFTAIGDLRRAYLIITDKPHSSKTPFDFIFWPVMKEHATGLHRASVIILVGLTLAYLLYLYFSLHPIPPSLNL